MTESDDQINTIINSLSLQEKEAILNIDDVGNGHYIYQVFGLVKKGLMSLKPIPKLQMIKAYRLNELGYRIKDILKANRD